MCIRDRLEKRSRIRDDVEAGCARRADRGGMWDTEERREVAKDGAGFGRSGDRNVVLDHLHGAFDEDVEKTGAVALREERFAPGKVLYRMIAERGENGRHGAPIERKSREKRKSFLHP